MQRRPGRTLLTLLGIVIGVAATLAISVTVQATRRAHRDMFEAVSGRAALEVVAEGLGGFDQGLAARLETVPGVRAAVPVIQTPVALLGRSGAVPVLALGIDTTRDRAARDYVLREGRSLEASGERQPPEEVLLESGFATAQGFALGQPVRLLTPTGFTSLSVVGLLEPRGAAAFNGGAVVFLPLARAQRLLGLSGQVNSIQLVLEEGASQRQVEAELLQRVPAGLVVQTPGARGETGRDSMVATEHGLAALSLCSLVAGAFVILNAFHMNLGERRQQLAILRALGATRSQVTRLLLREAVVLGGAGTVLGIGAGWVLSVGLRQVMEQLLSVTLPALRWTSEPFLLALALGPGMALAATYLPARRAGRRAPLEDLLGQRAVHGEDVRRWPGYVGLGLLAGTLLFVQGTVQEWFGPAVALACLQPALVTLLVGCVLILPLVLEPLTRLAGLLLRPLGGREGSLALRQLLRHRARTALTAGVLLVAVVFAVGFGQSLRNNVRHIYEWWERVIDIDFYVRGSWPDQTAQITTAAVPEALAEEIAALDGVERVGKFSFVAARAGGRPVVILAFTVFPEQPVSLALVHGDPDDARHGLLQGEVVLGTALAQRLGLDVGDAITVQTRQGPRPLRIAGTASEYTGGGMALYMDWDVARRYFDLQGVHTLFVTARAGAAAELGPRLRAFCDERGFLYQSNADARRVFDRQMDGFLGSIWLLLALVFVVASLGIVNTLTMNVLEQTRELGVLRAIGMQRHQVRRLIFSQALAFGVVSLVPGILAGIVLAYFMNRATYPLLGHPVPFHLDAVHIGGCAAVALGIAVLSAYVPARRAARLQVIRALQYE
jgi:putative ABC transport system permease protein